MTENRAEITAEDGEELSPGELAYLESGGTNSAALEAEISARGSSADQASDQAAQVTTPPPAGGPNADQVEQAGKPAAQGSGPNAAQVEQVKKEGEKSTLVPLYEVQKEREKRQALESELAQFRERFSRADERQKLLNELLGIDAQKAAPAQEPIDPEKDIFGAFKQLQQRFNELQGKTAEVDTRVNQQSEEQQLRQAYHADASRFMQATPDFGQAYNHLMQIRDQELSALGIADANERRAIMTREEQQIAKSALTGGRSAAEVIYNLAKLRGFQAPAQEAKGGQQVTPSTQSDAAKQLEAVQKGREAALSLSSAGASSAGELTIQALADMPEDEFERAYAKMSESTRRKFLGG